MPIPQLMFYDHSDDWTFRVHMKEGTRDVTVIYFTSPKHQEKNGNRRCCVRMFRGH